MIKPICFGFGSTVKIIDSFFQFIWNIIRTLNIQLLLTVCALWFILANVLPGEALTTAFWVIFAVLAGISAVYAIAATLYSFVRYLRESSKKSPMKKEPVEISIKDVTEEEKPVDTRSAIGSGVIDNYAFHAALISVAVFLGWIINYALKKYLNFSAAWFVTGLFGGLLVWLVIKRPWGKAVDTGTLGRIQGIL